MIAAAHSKSLWTTTTTAVAYYLQQQTNIWSRCSAAAAAAAAVSAWCEDSILLVNPLGTCRWPESLKC